jgi:cell wall-associated NlpC family hydrolase
VRAIARVVVLAGTAAIGACATATAARPAAFPNARPADRVAARDRVAVPESPASPAEALPPAASTTVVAAASGISTAATADAIIQTALGLRGVPYRLGGESPDTGFDCSGFVRHVFREHAITLPRTTAEQFTTGQPVERDTLQTGDLVFFSTIGPGPTHVGLVIANAGRLEFVHAPADGASVRVERLETDYWQRRWIGARRVF